MATTSYVDAAMVRFEKWLDHPSIASENLKKQKHQFDGVRWLLGQELVNEPLWNVRGGLLADEMGLGKTIQMLGVIIAHNTSKTNTLIVLPPALVPQWKNEITRLFKVTPVVYHGVQKRSITLEKLASSPIVLTTYGTIATRKRRIDEDEQIEVHSPLTQIKWGRVIYDEVHHLRNNKTAQYKGAMKIQSSIKWLVTGTPIQNKKRDFINLCNIMGVPREFSGTDEGIKTIRSHFILRRTKDDVHISLPTLTDTIVTVPWKSSDEKQLAIEVHSRLGGTGVSTHYVRPEIANLSSCSLSALLRMKQMCIFPELIERAIHNKFDTEDTRFDTDISFSETSKLNAVLGKIYERKDNSRSKLVFCHFRGEIDWLLSSIQLIHKSNGENMKVGYIDGRTGKTARELILGDTSYDVVILQIKTCCEGLNLQQFKEVYFVSPHWNPCVEDQAIARSHRIGQTDNVDVFRFEMEGFGENTRSLDQYCRLIQQHKRDLIRTVFEVRKIIR